jgi:protein-disulfide isomerase/uncharacterized membrane protein
VKKAGFVLVVLAIVGLVASILLTQLHYKVEKNGFEEKSFCNVSELIDCDTVVASRYSSVKLPFLTVPNSELGILYYLLLIIGVGYAASAPEDSRKRRVTLAFLFGSMVLATLYSVLMAYLSIGKLHVICLMCSVTYAVNVLMLLFFPAAMGISWGQAPTFLAENLFNPERGVALRVFSYVGASVVLLAVGLLFFKGLNPAAHLVRVPVPRDLYLKAFREQPAVDIDTAGRPVWGNPHAKVKIVEFSDFQCPFCKRAAFTMKPYLKSYKDDVAFYFMNFPLDTACNALLEHGVHQVACLAAKGGVCAAQQGKFWEYHDQVFENQKKLSRSKLIEVAAHLGLDGPTFEKCLVSDETQARIAQDVEQGGKAKIQGTPSIFINGRLFRDWPDAERVRMVIESERVGPTSPEARRSAESSPAP